jgi:hypothetical protein
VNLAKITFTSGSFAAFSAAKAVFSNAAASSALI